MTEQINPFAKAQAAREAEQAQIKNNLGIQSIQSNTNIESQKNRRVRLDVTIPANTKQKLLDYAKRKGLSASVVVQLLIDNTCI